MKQSTFFCVKFADVYKTCSVASQLVIMVKILSQIYKSATTEQVYYQKSYPSTLEDLI